MLGGDDVGDGLEADARRGGAVERWIAAEQAEPLLGDDDGGGDAVPGGEEAAEVQHRVDVAAARVGHGHDVAGARGDGVHGAVAPRGGLLLP